ncbi:SAM-dependent methyltransferase [Pseudidiomarina tainanensis]|uniref:SAM-dependent methyltransferase n=1 Tax=Pseudidiomarina tainanensis TaxID=502365 RepID=A0ACD2HJB5_9GAMM|nr:class I SAM-dependent methyltransferase [Pseudidiomarina tainanensis]RZQ56615.1 SAM-dependent methyltransferase [Pseudidiomarina tainanensis]
MQEEHWEEVYQTKAVDRVSWFQSKAETSLRLITDTGMSHDAPLIDIGSGASRLIDNLITSGFTKITALDISTSALNASKKRLKAKAEQVTWLVGDVLESAFAAGQFAIWHDRAVFHFLITSEQQQRYVEQAAHAVEQGGYVVIATFAEDGPEKCSGLPVQRYSAQQLAEVFAPQFSLVHTEREIHKTPHGAEQKFNYCVLRRN